ncbi:MAG: signal peptide peptidase SppA [Deltaproteobacteria bacterium]|nr:signal peptide peptidase SppA [Deltaproteobacteria bacterium]
MISFIKRIGSFFNGIAAALGWLFIIFNVLLLMAVLSIIGGGSVELDDLTSKLKSDKVVAVLNLEGEIGSMINVSEFREELDKQVNNSKVKGIVVRIDSPGGTVGGSEDLYYAIKSAKEKKPVICSLGDVAASGGLYVASACDKVVTNKGTLTGSIGVIMMMPNFSSIMSKYDLEMTVIKSGEFKDSGSPFRKLSDSDRELLQTLVGESHNQFVQAVAQGRGLKEEDVRKFADGRIILGEDAVALGLADEIGDVSKAAKLVLAKLSLEGEPEVVYPEKKKGFEKLVDNLVKSKLFSIFTSSYNGAQLRYQWIY